MDPALARFVDQAVSAVRTRRAALGAVVAAALTAPALGAAAEQPARKERTRVAAKKAKKCKAPNQKCGKACCRGIKVCVKGKCKEGCIFTKTDTLWTLQDNCTTPLTIKLPPGVSFDGNGYGITAARGINPVVATTGDAPVDIRNLTVEGPGYICPEGTEQIALQLNGPATVANAVIRDVCSGIVFAERASRYDATVENMDLQRVDIGVNASSQANLAITGGYIGGASIGIAADVSTSAQIIGVTIDDAGGGISVAAAPNTTPMIAVTGCQLYGCQRGVVISADGMEATASVSSCTVQRIPTRFYDAAAGIDYRGTLTGNIANNDIWGYRDRANSAGSGCGIRLNSSVSPSLTMSANTFPTPPGNNSNICDERP